MIGYWLGEQFQGKGIMTAACRVLVNYAFNEFKLHRVEIKCATGNTKSCAIPERLLFYERRDYQRRKMALRSFCRFSAV